MDETAKPSDKLKAAFAKGDEASSIEAIGEVVDHLSSLLMRLVVATEACAVSMDKFATAMAEFTTLVEVDDDEPGTEFLKEKN